MIAFLKQQFSRLVEWLGKFFQRLAELFTDMLNYIWDFISRMWFAVRDAVNAVLNWTIDFISAVLFAVWEWTYDFTEWLWDWVVAKAAAVWTWLASVLDGLGLLPDMQPMQTAMTQLSDAWGVAAWLLPLNQVAAVFAATVTLLFGIRFGRWVYQAALDLIP